MKNPFVTNGYAGAEYFCDRVQETQFLISMLTNGNNVALISPRRIGKTDLIRHCFCQEGIKENYHTFLIDIYATKNFSEMVALLGKTIIDSLRSKGRSAWEQFLQIVSSVRSEISFDINGSPVWGIGAGTISQPAVTLDEIFRYLSEADKHCLVAIDEFQQITHYTDGENVEAALRTHIQRCPNANFIFSGSQRHLMGEIFTSPSRPFYQSVTVFNLKPIPVEKYSDFVSVKFEEAGKSIEPDVVPLLYHRFRSTTSYMQKIMNYMFQITPAGETCTSQMIEEGIDYIINLSADTYEGLLYQLPEKQRKTLVAIAQEGEAKAVTSGAFAKRHQLQSPSAVVAAVKGLLEKDFITRENNTYRVYDLFLQQWIEKHVL
ncbi:MAG: ATP-binding protein [Bacteroidales bacterium]|nr:ATP-binding protein [Bacteroidales bacterium]